MHGKELFLAKQKTSVFYPPDDISFEIYSSEIWKGFVSKLDNKNLNIIDVGCGGGTTLHVLQQLGYKKLSGIDYIDTIPKSFVKDFKFYHEDIFDSTLKDNDYDALVAAMVIEHVPEKAFVDELYRILKPNGLGLVTSVLKNKYAWYWYKNKHGKYAIHPDHIKEYTSVKEFENLFKRKFDTLLIRKTLLKYPIFDPVAKFLMNIRGFGFLRNAMTTNKFLKKLRLLRIIIPNYYAVEILVRKNSKLSQKNER